jgi:signal transduction histidine kinase
VRRVNTIRERVGDLWANDRGRLVHYFVATSIGTLVVVEMATIEPTSWDLVAFSVVVAAALLLTRELPFVAPVVIGAGLVGIAWAAPVPVYDLDSPFAVILFTAWSIGTYNDRTKAIVGFVYFELTGLLAARQFAEYIGDYFWISMFIAVSWTTGFVVSRRSQYARELVERARRIEQEQREAAERAVIEERQRIARELHDVIAHSVSVMTVQTSAVRRLLKPDQEKEREALETVESTGRQALTEMRRLVGLLREQGAMPEFSPQPGMGTIDTLLDGVRAAGLPVELEVDGSPRELTPGMDLAAYRVVQEALTNALKYAGPAHAWVAVNWRDAELELEIANDGRGDGDGTGGGHGLSGMRERVSLYGGEIESGPRDGGGYVVRARLPLEEVA